MTQKEFQVETGLSICNCCTCGAVFAIPEKLKARLQECHNTFYCPNGHPLHYPGKSETEILYEKLEYQEKRTDFYRKEAKIRSNQVRAYKGQLTKLKKAQNK